MSMTKIQEELLRGFPNKYVNAAKFGVNVGNTASENRGAIQAALNTGRKVLLPPRPDGLLADYLFDYPLIVPDDGGFAAGGIRSRVRLRPTIPSPGGQEIVTAICSEFDEFKIDDVITTVTTGYNASSGDCIKADTSSAGLSVTLPSTPANGNVVKVKKVTSDFNLLTVASSGTASIITLGGTVTSLNILHQNFLYLRYISSIDAWTVDLPASLELGPLWMRGDYAERVRGVKLEGAQYWRMPALWLERFHDNCFWMDAVSDPTDGLVIKNTNWNEIGKLFAIDCPATGSRAVYIGGTESGSMSGGDRNFAGRSDNGTFGFVRAGGADIGVMLEFGTGNHFDLLNPNGNNDKGAVIRCYGNDIAMARLEANGNIGMHFEEMGDGFTDRNFVAAIHNGGGQTNLVVDDNGTNWWPYVDSGRIAWNIPKTTAGLETGATATMAGSLGRDDNGTRIYDQEFRLSGNNAIVNVEDQGASRDSTRGTYGLRSTIRSEGLSAQWGFLGSTGEYVFENYKTNPTFVFNAPVTIPGGSIKAEVFALPEGPKLTISAGVVTITHGHHGVDTEGAAATDDLDTINGGTDGQILVLLGWSGARQVTVKDGTGNINPAGDFTFVTGRDRLVLQYRASVSTWYELSRVTN